VAYPIITDIFRAQVVFQGPSGLAEDQYVNNWYFRNDDSPLIDPATLAGYIASVLDAFYDGTFAPAVSPISDRLWDGVTEVTYKVYDLGQPTPRYPIVEPTPRPWVPDGGGTPLPGEVACCLSYKAGNGARKRGRVYIGPLDGGVVDQAGSNPRVQASFQQQLGLAAVNVLNTSENVTWMQVSPTAGIASEVQEVWVDNSFDTQRSRGASPTSRRRWDASGEIV
jgi:hypothetical protein